MKKTLTPKKQEIVVIDNEIKPIVSKFEGRDITNETDMKDATVALSKLNVILDRLVADREKITKPLNQTLLEVRSRYKPAETQLKSVIENLRQIMGDYQTEQIRIQNEEAEKIANRVGEGKGHLKPETAANQIAELETPEKRVVTEAGSITFRTDQVLKITDIQKVRGYAVRTQDWSFIEINEAKLLKDLKAGKVVDGAEITEVQVPVNRR